MALKKKLLVIIWTIGLVGVFLPVSRHARRNSQARATLFEKPALADIDVRLVNVLTLGHRGLYDDFLAIHSLQYLVDQKLVNVDPKVTRETLMVAARQSPKVQSFYMLGCFAFAYDLKHPEWCEELNLIGANALPEGWRIPLTQGFIFMNEMKDQGAAAKWYALAASRPGAPSYVGSLANKLAQKSDLTVDDLAKSLEMMVDAPGGSKLRDILEKAAARKKEETKP